MTDVTFGSQPMTFITPDGSRTIEDTGRPIDEERWTRWVTASGVLARVDEMLVVTCQAIGRLDGQLVAEHQRFVQQDLGAPPTDAEVFRFGDNTFFSYLWVLAAYELTRTLDQQGRANWSFEEKHLDAIRSVKVELERVRIPLAKLEPSRRNPEDSAIAFPVHGPDHGIGWAVADGVYIDRLYLADRLLKLLEVLHEAG